MASSRSPAPLMPGRIVVACDATKSPSAKEFENIISNIQMRKEMIQEVDTITVLGVLHKVLHPMGFQIQIGPDSFIGTRVRAIKEEVSRMVDAYLGKLQHSAEECEGSGVVIEVKIVVGAPLKEVIVQEAIASNATWVVLNRHLKKELRFYLKHIPCKVAVTLDNFSLKVLRPSYSDKASATDNIEFKLFYTLSKLVPLIPAEYYPIYHGSTSSQGSSGSDKSSFASSVTSKSKDQQQEFVSNSRPEKQVSTDIYAKSTDKYDNPPPVKLKQSDSGFSVPYTANKINSKLNTKESKFLEIQIVANASLYGDLSREDTDKEVATESHDSFLTIQKHRNLQLESHEMKMQPDWKGWKYSEIQTATNDFSCDNLVGEDEYGFVYKGRLKDGQLIAVKVMNDANKRGFSEFHSQLCALSLACHKNILMLLGYCHRENTNILLVYEYIFDRSLEWHLFDNTERVLEWHQRHAIAVGIAKGLRFLHEECRGSPILHRDMKLTNIFLTPEGVPLLSDCGLAKWKMNKHGASEYAAPEYAENGICSVKTDVFAFGIILIQLISGRRGVDREWARQLIMSLKLDELVDPRLGDSYGMYELYQMARVAYLCIQNKSSIRPTVGEVLLILEGENDRLR